VLLLVFGEHGRELISSQVALRILTLLCPIPTDGGGAAAVAASKIDAVAPPPSPAEVAALAAELTRTELLLLPLAVPASRVAVEQGEACARLNERGVDVNRNFGHAWGGADATSVPPEEHPGAAPFSETHPRRVAAAVAAAHPDAYVSVHAGDAALLTPWDCGCGPVRGVSASQDVAAAADRRRRSHLGRAVASLRSAHCRGCAAGTAASLFGYNAFGTSGDWAWAAARVRWVLTWEVFGDGGAHHDDCVRLFNPVGAASVGAVVENWARAPFTLARVMHAVDGAAEVLVPSAAADAAVATPTGDAAAATAADAAVTAAAANAVRGGRGARVLPIRRLVRVHEREAGVFGGHTWASVVTASVALSAASLGIVAMALGWRPDAGRRGRGSADAGVALSASPSSAGYLTPSSRCSHSGTGTLLPAGSAVSGVGGGAQHDGGDAPGDTYMKMA